VTVWTAFRWETIAITAAWAASEVALTILTRSKSGALVKADRASIAAIWVTTAVSIFLGVRFGERPAGFIAAGSLAISGTGLVLMLAGLAVRWAAILTLGRFFTADVSIQREHRIVETGFYRGVRHPSYAGGLLTFIGLGLTFSNIWSALVLTVLPLGAFLYRISVEERALVAYFGDDYVRYKRRTKRLIPWVY